MPSPATTDLCDAHPEIQVCDPVFQMFGGNVRVQRADRHAEGLRGQHADQAGGREPGRGPGARRRRRGIEALRPGRRQPRRLGGDERLGRDRRLRLHPGRRRAGRAAARRPRARRFPRKSERGLHSGQAGRPVVFAGVTFREGAWLAADGDGVVVLPAGALTGQVVRRSSRASRWVRPAGELGGVGWPAPGPRRGRRAVRAAGRGRRPACRRGAGARCGPARPPSPPHR